MRAARTGPGCAVSWATLDDAGPGASTPRGWPSFASAGPLLRAPSRLTTSGPAARAGRAHAGGRRTLWLGAAGRSQAEPFDEADGACWRRWPRGGVALANAELYAEVQQQREKLSVITSSLGEGVCAVRETGEITFMNPAGAAMLGWSAEGTVTTDADRARSGGAGFLLDPAMRAIALRRTSPVTTPASTGPTVPTSRSP